MIQVILHTAGTILDLAALASVTGIAWCLMALMPGGTVPEIIIIRMRRFLVAGLSLLVVSSIDSLIQRGIEMSGLSIMSVLPMLPTIIFKSHYGNMWMVRIAGLLAAWLVVIA